MTTQTYNGRPYWAFNLDNLDIAGSGTTSPSPTPTPTPSRRPRQPHRLHRPRHPLPSPTPTPIPTPSPTPIPTRPPIVGPVLTAPANLAAVAVGASGVDLSWSASSGAAGYIVERMTGGGMWVLIARGVVATSFQDTGLPASTTYQYAVVAFSGTSESAFSATATVQTGATTTAQAGDERRAIDPADRDDGRPEAVIQRGGGHVRRHERADAAGELRGDDPLGRRSLEPRDGHRLERPVHRGRPASLPGRGPIHRPGGRDDVRSVGAPAHTSTASTAAVGVPLRVIKRAAKLGTALWRARRGPGH